MTTIIEKSVDRTDADATIYLTRSAVIFNTSSVVLYAFAGSLRTDCQISPCLGSLRLHLDIKSSRVS